ncbi:MAG: 3-oxoadipate enol-lactonase 2 [Candidatus Thorarchaeota archaeon]|nr:MAG: 3-oxoadipate enol-lactonase 2 [Candidatus Thorarchaeota archaeon]
MLEKEGTKISYQISGNESGPKLILIHGLFLNADCWRDQLPYFEQDYHILRFDLHGHGRSIKTGKRYTIRNYVTDMMILLSHLGWNENLSFVGHSLGGMVALVYALEHPNQIEKLVIASSYCFVSNEAVTDVAGRVQGNPIDKFALGIGKRGLSPYDEETAQWIANMVTDHMTQKDALYATAASAGFNICENLSNLEIPTLLIVGKEDITTPVWASEMLHEWLPQSEIVIVEEAGHLIINDHSEEFNRLVDDFLKK